MSSSSRNQSIWLFDDPEFRAWLDAHPNFDQPQRTGPATGGRCTACGTPLREISHRFGRECGYCVAYQFGVFSQAQLRD